MVVIITFILFHYAACALAIFSIVYAGLQRSCPEVADIERNGDIFCSIAVSLVLALIGLFGVLLVFKQEGYGKHGFWIPAIFK